MSLPINSLPQHRRVNILDNLEQLQAGLNLDVDMYQDNQPPAPPENENFLEQLQAYQQGLRELREQLNPGGEFDELLQELIAPPEREEQAPRELSEPLDPENRLAWAFELSQSEIPPQRSQTPQPSVNHFGAHSLFASAQRQAGPSTQPRARGRSNSI